MTHRSPADDDVVWGGEGRVRGRGRRSTRNGAWPAGVASRMGRGRRDRRPGHALCDLRRRCGDQPPMASVHQFRPQPALDSLATDTTSVVTTRVSHELVVFCFFFLVYSSQLYHSIRRRNASRFLLDGCFDSEVFFQRFEFFMN